MIDLDIQYHFLDSNVFLGIALDSHNSSCEDYFHLHFNKITSDKVEKESELVILKFLIISISILKYIAGHIEDGNVSDNEIPKSIRKLENKFSKEYWDEKYPFGFKKERFLSLTHELFQRYYYLIKKGIYYKPFDLIITEQCGEVSSSYQKSVNSLQDLFKLVKVYSFTEEAEDQNIIDKFNSDVIHNPDAEILLDAYKIAKLVNDYLIFITNDAGIINNSDIVLSNLESMVICRKPEEFLNN